ncbi:MAG: hypothetical protein GX591_18365 [Planctomycetes bacterium]|nr:hypothetical protein [Planctomycetota bacterium]
MSLKNAVKQYAYDLGADLVGVGNIERCEHAPPMMSPQGLLPTARSVIVMALRHPDGCIETGGETHPQAIGAYRVQYLMNNRLDELSYRMATFLERRGAAAVPIVSSNIWRYTAYKDLDAIFAPDVSHIYMAVVAGLAEVGYSGLALTPEFGARNRFVTVVTDAALEPDPLIEPGTVCDHCMLCRTHCPAEALSKEVDGEKVLRIEGREYRFANKNLWRCSWGEHFDLDLDLPKPERVDEAVILDALRTHGMRAGEMGQCLKFCVPAPLRTWDRGYSRTPMRRPAMVLDESAESRAVMDRLITRAHAAGVEHVIAVDADKAAALGFDLNGRLKGALSAVLLAAEKGDVPAAADSAVTARDAAYYHCESAMYDLARGLEDLGFRSVTCERDQASKDFACALLSEAGVDPEACQAAWVITRKTIASRTSVQRAAAPAFDAGREDDNLVAALERAARGFGADLFGIASAERIDALAAQLRPHYEGVTRLVGRGVGGRFLTPDWQIREEPITVRTAEDVLAGARSVIVLGLRVHRAVVDRAGRPPAEAVGPYAFQTYVTHWLASQAALRLGKALQAAGHRAAITGDLMGLASALANPQGPKPDFTSSRFAAIAAGLGRLTTSGRVATPQFGVRQRFFCVVTDAVLPASPLADTSQGLLCEGCDRCTAACPAGAFSGGWITLTLEGRQYRYQAVDERRCDWSRRYALQAASGFGLLGSPLDAAPPEVIDAPALKAALDRHDPIRSHRPVVAEPCMLACPYARAQP